MAITCEEAANSREWDSQGACTLRYVVQGTDNDYLALLAVLGIMPSWITAPDGTTCYPQKTKPSLAPVHADTATGVGVWTCEIVYKVPSRLDKPDPYPVGSTQLILDTTGGTKHITISRATLHSYASGGGSGLNHSQLIGVTEGGQPEGVDVPMAVFNLRAEHIFHDAAAIPANNIYALTGKINNASFTVTDTETGLSFTFPAGELLFRGANIGAQRGDGGIPVSYSFEASPSETITTVPGFASIAKGGWDYLWFEFSKQEVSGHFTGRPDYAYVEQVIPSGAFSGLGL